VVCSDADGTASPVIEVGWWDEGCKGCKSCSFIADSFDGMLLHVGARNTAFVAISRVPFRELIAFLRPARWQERSWRAPRAIRSASTRYR